MKRAVFVEMEGLLTERGDFRPDEEKTQSFLKGLSDYCSNNNIKLCLITGYHKDVAEQKFSDFMGKYFDRNNFFYVDESYIKGKEDADEARHRENLEKDGEFNDAYFKQVALRDFMEREGLSQKDILLLAEDLWVDGFYTIKFSGVDFAIFEENVTEKGKPAQKIPGLAYFNSDFESVRVLIEDFPEVDTSALKKHVFDSMAKVLMKDVDFSGLVEKAKKQKGTGNGQESS